MSKQLNNITLKQILTKNKLTTTQLFGSFKTNKLYKYLKIIKKLQSKYQLFISKTDYKKFYRPYLKYLKTYIKTNSVPRPNYYSCRMKINKLYTLCNKKSKSLLHSIILSLYYNFTPEEIIKYFSNIV